MYCTIHCIEIHPVDSVFHPLNNWGLIFPQGEYIFEAFELKASQAKSKSTLYHLDLYPSLEKKRKLAYTKSVTFKLLHLLTHILHRWSFSPLYLGWPQYLKELPHISYILVHSNLWYLQVHTNAAFKFTT